jgi:hypothetical protein
MDYYHVTLIYPHSVVTVTVRTLKGGSYEDWYMLDQALAVLNRPGSPFEVPSSHADQDRVRGFSDYFVTKLKGRGEMKGVSVGDDGVYRRKTRKKRNKR